MTITEKTSAAPTRSDAALPPPAPSVSTPMPPPPPGSTLAPTPAPGNLTPTQPAAFAPPEHRPLAQPTIDPEVELSPRALVDEGYIEKRAGLSRLPKVPFELFAAVVVGTILLGAAALSNLSGRGDAEAEQRLAEARLASAEVDGTDMAETNAALAVENADLEAVIVGLESDLASSNAATEQAVADLAAVPEFDTTLLDNEISELRTDKVALLERATTAEASLADAGSPEETPGFHQFVGERLAVQSLSAQDAQCFGSAVIADVGLEIFGAGINSDRTAAANDALIDAMAGAGASCGIASTTIFGG